MPESTFTINSLATATPSLSDFIIKSDENVNYRKCTLEQLKDLIITNAFPASDVDISSLVLSGFTVSRARLKMFGNIHWYSIQVTVTEAFSAPYGKNVFAISSTVAPYPDYTAELCGFNATELKCVRAYRSSANISVVGDFSVGDVIVIGGMYIV